MYSTYALMAAVVLQAVVLPTRADPNDWIHVDYIVRYASSANSRSKTAAAQDTIIRLAQGSSSRGNWSVTNGKDVLPPSANPHDYLSWAPYHWPNCNWCATAGRTHLVHSGDGTNDTSPGNGGESLERPPETPDDDSLWEEGVEEEGGKFSRQDPDQRRQSAEMHGSRGFIVRRNIIPTEALVGEDISLPQMPLDGRLPLPTSPPVDTITSPSAQGSASWTTDSPPSNTHAPAQAAARTSKTSCTPSPTESLPPSATWTTCQYVVRDGRVNPDVLTLPGVKAINGLSQAVLYNAIAYALSSSTVYSRNLVRLIDFFFLDEPTRMYPNMNYGQLIRGPGPDGTVGTWTGILDLRGLVKVVNSIHIIKGRNSPDWTPARDRLMNDWMSQYAKWLTGSNLGKETASRLNNHVSHYVSQVAATQIFAGDRDGAVVTLKNYFNSKFAGQIAASGEQPFEAVRTRPFHYRCFNIEAMITNAKLGDEFGLNFWTAKSKYGATIQTAVDFTMNLDPKSEDVSELAPHVAATAAVYGDPTGKYAKFLQKTTPDYRSRPFFLYDQPAAFPGSKDVEKADTYRRMAAFDCEELSEAGKLLDNGIRTSCEDLLSTLDSIR